MVNPLTPTVSADVVIATGSARIVIDGTAHRVRRGRTTAHSDATIVAARPDIWAPMVVDYPSLGPATDDQPPPSGPSAKDVRAWANAQGIDVPARGKLPDELVARYEAEQGG